MQKYFRGFNPLFIASTFIILLILLPSLTLLVELFSETGEHWSHIKEYLLNEYITNSLILVISVGLITSVFGTFFSWILSQYDFKYNKLMFFTLYIPLAIPTYIAAYVYGGIFGYSGSLERIFRNIGLSPIHIDVFSMGGAIFVFSLFLMPYVVLVTKSFYHKLPSSYFDSSRLLGKTSMQTVFKIILPMSRGAIMGGVVLVVLEVLNDYGLVKYFGIPTFSTAIYTTWFGLSDISSAIRLAVFLMIFVFIILTIENFSRGRGRISQPRALAKFTKKKKPSKLLSSIFLAVYSIYIIFSLIIPVTQLIYWSYIASEKVVLRGLTKVLIDTFILAISVTFLVLIFSIIIGNYSRLKKSFISKIYSRIVILGYSIPASIIAIAVMTFFLKIDRSFSSIYEFFSLKSLFLTSSIFMLLFALSIRFMAIGFNSIESGYKKMGVKYYEASKLLGQGEFKTFFKIDLPLLKPAIISAFILTFVDVLKELPLTLILRPFNYNTLATRAFTYAGDEMIHEASVYALIIISVSVVSLIAMNYIQREKRYD